MYTLDENMSKLNPGDVEFNIVTCGVFECAHVLETSPEEVVLCILPTWPSEDLSVSIQQKLIEAHCVENAIQIMKIDGTEELSALVKMLKDDGTCCNCEFEESNNLTCTLLSRHVEKLENNAGVEAENVEEIHEDCVEISPD